MPQVLGCAAFGEVSNAKRDCTRREAVTRRTLGTPTPYEGLAALLSDRHSCRAFLTRPVPEVTIRRLLELAQRAPSWGNVQPWRLWVISGRAIERFRTALVEEAARGGGEQDFPFPARYPELHFERRREAAMQLFRSVGAVTRSESARQMAENFTLFGAPHVAIVTTDADLGVYGAVDCGLYVMAFMLAASSLGVACVAQAALARHSSFIRAHLGIAGNCRVVCGISFGYEDTAHAANAFRTTRADVDAVVTWVAADGD
jgi:nitroreductase